MVTIRRYKRRRLGGNRRYGRRRYTRRLSKRVKRVERGVKRINQTIETKRVENSWSDILAPTVNTTNGTAPIYYPVSGLVQGTGSIERIGLDIRATSMFLGMQFTKSSTDTSNAIRVLVVKDKHWYGQGVNPRVDQYVQDANGTFPSIDLIAPYSWPRRDKFRVLMDKVIHVTNDRPVVTLYKNFRLNTRIKWLNNSSGISSIERNNLFVMFYSDSTATSHPTVSGFTRVKFRDA